MKRKESLDFDKWVNMCRSAAWNYAKKYGIEYDDLEAQAFMVYVDAIPRWQPKKATFSTFLTWRLKTLGDYCRQMKKQREYVEFDSILEQTTAGAVFTPGIIDLLKAAAESISSDAVEVLAWILYRRWEGRRSCKPSFTTARRVFKYEREWDIERTEGAWNEIKDFWLGGTLVAVYNK